MKKIFFLFFLALVFFVGQVAAQAAQVTLAWDANTEPELAGYKLYYGTESGQYSYFYDAGSETTYTVSNLTGGTRYFFAATAYSTEGLESDFSNEVTYDAPTTCTYVISPTSRTIASSGGTGTITVTTQSSCSWTAVGTSWMAITSGNSGIGNGTVNYSVSVNSSTSSRTAAISVAGKVFTMTQSGTPTTTYALTVTKSGTGTGTVTNVPSGTSFNSGTSVTLTAAPSANSTFSGWSGACSGTQTTCTLTMNANKSVGAAFAIKTYTLTASAGTGGSISPTGVRTVNSGSNKVYTITPATGYKVASVIVDGTSVGAVASYTFSNVIASHTISASFSLKPVPLYRFYRYATGAHSWGLSSSRDPALYRHEGLAFHVYLQQVPGTVPLYMFLKFNGGEFYTTSLAEKTSLMGSTAFTYVGIPFYVGGPIPVYRFYNKVVNVNFFTASVSEKNSLAANTLQFAYDGVGFGTPSPP